MDRKIDRYADMKNIFRYLQKTTKFQKLQKELLQVEEERN